MQDIYKRCNCCGTVWASREDLVRDPAVKLVGYQACFSEPADGLFLFNHIAANCRTTIAVPVADFADYWTGEKPTVRAHGTPACPGYCVQHDDFRQCNVACDMRWIRDVLQLLRNHEVPAHVVAPGGPSQA